MRGPFLSSSTLKNLTTDWAILALILLMRYNLSASGSDPLHSPHLWVFLTCPDQSVQDLETGQPRVIVPGVELLDPQVDVLQLLQPVVVAWWCWTIQRKLNLLNCPQKWRI